MITHLAAIVATCFSLLPRTEPLDLELPAASRLALPQSVAWEKHTVFRSTFANRLFDGRERTWDPDTIVVYYFGDGRFALGANFIYASMSSRGQSL